MEEGEEGTEKKVSTTTGFITGQLMMFISIYYAPMHLALGRPHTITVLALPYLLFHFFWNNHKHFFDYGSTTRNSMRNLSIQCGFLNNLIFQLFNHFILPSRIPSPILTKNLKETSKMEERDKQLTKRRGLNRNKRDPPKKILLLPFFGKKRRIRTKSMKQKRSE
ncbi:hypothetical protein HYC85_003062 [Camellia sinensis]|uniref:Protein TIC 214 n=1 Tax=Camellia sinensis TaxID=4442 RepID=A0A7J7IA43_CAMSI|nr:hypothetical protein HYC85_003062 [Camellia sinensis]